MEKDGVPIVQRMQSAMEQAVYHVNQDILETNIMMEEYTAVHQIHTLRNGMVVSLVQPMQTAMVQTTPAVRMDTIKWVKYGMVIFTVQNVIGINTMHKIPVIPVQKAQIVMD